MSEAERFSLKDHLFNRQKIVYLASLFAKADSNFKTKEFERDVMKTLLTLELKERITLITDVLEKHLPKEFKTATKIIIKALPAPLDPTKTDNDFGDFIFAPLGEFVARNGTDKKHLKVSLATLRELTMRFSMEDAIRTFIKLHPNETLETFYTWVEDDNYHVRRLVSEGTRPLLPWSGRIQLTSKETLPLLTILHSDPTRYVTRSVSNHLNDISKSDPELVVATLKRWQKAQLQNPKELEWMTRHSLRTLIKQGDPGTMELLGYHQKPKVAVSDITLNKTKIKRGETLEFSFSVSAKSDEKLLIDYILDFKKTRGSATKVFKIKSITLEKGETVKLVKRHHFKADATTFKLHPGEHAVTLQINGKASKTASFYLV